MTRRMQSLIRLVWPKLPKPAGRLSAQLHTLARTAARFARMCCWALGSSWGSATCITLRHSLLIDGVWWLPATRQEGSVRLQIRRHVFLAWPLPRLQLLAADLKRQSPLAAHGSPAVGTAVPVCPGPVSSGNARCDARRRTTRRQPPRRPRQHGNTQHPGKQRRVRSWFPAERM